MRSANSIDLKTHESLVDLIELMEIDDEEEEVINAYAATLQHDLQQAEKVDTFIQARLAHKNAIEDEKLSKIMKQNEELKLELAGIAGVTTNTPFLNAEELIETIENDTIFKGKIEEQLLTESPIRYQVNQAQQAEETFNTEIEALKQSLVEAQRRVAQAQENARQAQENARQAQIREQEARENARQARLREQQAQENARQARLREQQAQENARQDKITISQTLQMVDRALMLISPDESIDLIEQFIMTFPHLKDQLISMKHQVRRKNNKHMTYKKNQGSKTKSSVGRQGVRIAGKRK